jgi:bacillithiol system protein YtxJ
MKEIIDESGLEAAVAMSEESPVFLFKHSTTCPISSAAYREVAEYEGAVGGVDSVYLIKVIESRPVSNAVSARTGVTHQSPQLLLVDSGEVVWNASHYEISKEKMVSAAGGEKRE